MTSMLVLSGAAMSSAADTFDIVPRSWITGGGCNCPQEAKGEAYIFPSIKDDTGALAEEARADLANFLHSNNRIPSCTSTFPIPHSDSNSKASYNIEIFRQGNNTPNLRIIASPDVVRKIRTLSWSDFQKLQQDFGCWLVQQNEPKYLFDRFQKRIEGFDENYCGRLQEFWRKVVETASLAKFSDHKDMRNHYFPKSLIRPANKITKNDGTKMGAIPLRPGMRLAIHWGGTAVYTYKKGSYTRPTVAGTSYIGIHGEQAPMLALDGNLTDTPTFKGMNPIDGINEFLPFGLDTKLTEKVAPIYNDFDLNNQAVLKPGEPAELILITPSSYIKTEPLVLPGGVSVPPQAQASEAFDDTLDVQKKIDASLLRRFAVLGLKNPVAAQSSLDEFDPKMKALVFDFRPMVFGHQTWVDVELPVSMNGMATFWQKVGARMSGFLDENASFLQFATPLVQSEPAVRFTRARLPKSSLKLDSKAEFRFWMTIPTDWSDKIELQPSDCFLFKP